MSTHFHSRLASLGWDSWFEERFESFAAEGLQPARIAADYGAEYLVHTASESTRAVLGRRLRSESAVLPSVGDWVGVLPRAWDTPAVIHGVVERRTSFSRKVVHRESREQVLAANVDVAFVVASAQDVNVRRIERYLAMAWQSGAVPAVVLTKSDLIHAVDEIRYEIESVAAGTPVLATSAVTGDGVEDINTQLAGARTGVLLGPSGAGKSTLINRMAGAEVMQTREVFRTGEGRHMTSHRELIELPAGGLIIDTPGLREAQLWVGDGALDNLFEDIEALVLQCRFPDCEHRSEPGCAVKAALADGSLDAGRLASYRKLQRELRSIAARSDARLRADERRKWKQITINNRARERYLRR
ncbi:MAG TPA: ribosome small subunit-dependent GTPase A [Candidatus Dormibacteraeota bacterium]|nr:ribosome small subunit-dependent GTPase A [Candidatus Dormibacteraeota bacterium]